MQQLVRNIDENTGSARPPADGEPVGQQAFLAALAPVLVDVPVFHLFDGSIARDHAESIWTWVSRDVAPDLAAQMAALHEDEELPGVAFDRLARDLIKAIDEACQKGAATEKSRSRLTVQMGGEAVRARLPLVITALKSRPAIHKALEFGKAANSLQDEAAIAAALKKMPLNDSALIAMMMHAAIGQVADPTRFVLAAIRHAGSAEDADIIRAGFGPLIEAMLSHAQSQVAMIVGSNVVHQDADLACRAIERYHRLVRAVTGYLEISRENIWCHRVTDLTRRMSERLETRLRGVTVEVNLSLRRRREGIDRIDAHDVLSALGGLYILRSVRACRDSLALNVVFERAWAESGRALETLLSRSLEDYRDRVNDPVRRERLDAGIKMAEIRFDDDYAAIMRRARDGAARVISSGG